MIDTFKTGDKVICTDNSYWGNHNGAPMSGLTEGQRYTIFEIVYIAGKDYFKIINDSGNIVEYWTTRFKPVPISTVTLDEELFTL